MRGRLTGPAGLALGLWLGACSLLDPAPGPEDALSAVRGMLDQPDFRLPPSFQPASVVVKACVKQQTPEGHVCDVVLVSTEMPVLGAISLPMRLRFAQREGRWDAFLM